MPQDAEQLKVDVHGVRIVSLDMAGALDAVESMVQCRRPRFICFFEGNLFSLSLGSEELRQVLNRADLVFADGVAVAKSARYRQGIEIPRVPGPSFLLQACDYGRSRGWRHFFYGGADGVAEALAERLKAQFPGLQVAGTYTPPFRPLTEAEESEVKDLVEGSGADLLWVGLGGPKQEYWMHQHLGKIQVPVMLGVGAAFDFHSGTRPWAPAWIRKLGLEWLYRAISGGRRTFFRNLRCVSHVGLVLGGDRLAGFFRKRSPQS